MKLKEKYRDKVQFLLCGGLDDNPKAIKEEDLKRVCDGEYIQWLGYRTDVLSLLKDCHIVAFPSYYKEGLPKSLIEATAVGRPIITTDSIGCKETVIEGYNGYLIPVQDSETLADRLEILIEDKALRQKMGKNSRCLAEKDFRMSFLDMFRFQPFPPDRIFHNPSERRRDSRTIRLGRFVQCLLSALSVSAARLLGEYTGLNGIHRLPLHRPAFAARKQRIRRRLLSQARAQAAGRRATISFSSCSSPYRSEGNGNKIISSFSRSVFSI